jgi:hypothetical protein
MRPVETIAGMEGGKYSWGELNYVRIFVNGTMHPQCNNNMVIFLNF